MVGLKLGGEKSPGDQEQPELAARSSGESVMRFLHRRLKGKPGPVGNNPKGPTLKQRELERKKIPKDQRRRMRPGGTRALQGAAAGQHFPQPATFLQAAQDAGYTGGDTPSFVVGEWFFEESVVHYAKRIFTHIAPWVVREGDVEDLEMGVMARLRVRRKAQRDPGLILDDRQQRWRNTEHIGWITHLASTGDLLVTAPSLPACQFLTCSYAELDNSPLLGDPKVSRVIAWMCKYLSNYGVCLLILAMLTNSWQAIWKDHGQRTAICNSNEFLDWMKYFLAQHTDSVNEQIANSLPMLKGDVPLNALKDCHSALQRGTALPPYEFNDWNSLPLEVDHHPLLTAGGQKAVFRKKATPFGSDDYPLGFEVMCLPLNQAAFSLWEATKQTRPIHKIP